MNWDWIPFRKKLKRVTLTDRYYDDMKMEYIVYKVDRIDETHVILKTSKKKTVDIHMTRPMDIVVEDL